MLSIAIISKLNFSIWFWLNDSTSTGPNSCRHRSSSSIWTGNGGRLRCISGPASGGSWSDHKGRDRLRRTPCIHCATDKSLGSGALDRSSGSATDRYSSKIEICRQKNSFISKLSQGPRRSHLQFWSTLRGEFTVEYNNIAHWSIRNNFRFFSLWIN